MIFSLFSGFHRQAKVVMLQNCGTRSDMGGVGELIGIKLQIACSSRCTMQYAHTLHTAH